MYAEEVPEVWGFWGVPYSILFIFSTCVYIYKYIHILYLSPQKEGLQKADGWPGKPMHEVAQRPYIQRGFGFREHVHEDPTF